jgi:cation transport ATPase
VQSIRTGNPNMWTLIGIGVTAAFAYSLVATIAPGLFPVSFQEQLPALFYIAPRRASEVRLLLGFV